MKIEVSCKPTFYHHILHIPTRKKPLMMRVSFPQKPLFRNKQGNHHININNNRIKFKFKWNLVVIGGWTETHKFVWYTYKSPWRKKINVFFSPLDVSYPHNKILKFHYIPNAFWMNTRKDCLHVNFSICCGLWISWCPQ